MSTAGQHVTLNEEVNILWMMDTGERCKQTPKKQVVNES
jgi:hypothetical protein